MYKKLPNVDSMSLFLYTLVVKVSMCVLYLDSYGFLFHQSFPPAHSLSMRVS